MQQHERRARRVTVKLVVQAEAVHRQVSALQRLWRNLHVRISRLGLLTRARRSQGSAADQLDQPSAPEPHLPCPDLEVLEPVAHAQRDAEPARKDTYVPAFSETPNGPSPPIGMPAGAPAQGQRAT